MTQWVEREASPNRTRYGGSFRLRRPVTFRDSPLAAETGMMGEMRRRDPLRNAAGQAKMEDFDSVLRMLRLTSPGEGRKFRDSAED